MAEMAEDSINQQKIVDMIESTIEEICGDFHDHGSEYFTENDLVCKFYDLLPSQLKEIRIRDKNKIIHSLVHMEYPTPFRCDMRKSSFRIVNDDERKIVSGKEGGKFKRGHYDIVVLNPLAIPQFSYEEIRSQKYNLFTKNVKNKISPSNPMIWYAIEFQLHRSNMTSNQAAINFLNTLFQDHDKLKASKVTIINGLGCPGFVDKFKTVAFFTDTRQMERLLEKTRDDSSIKLQPLNGKSRSER